MMSSMRASSLSTLFDLVTEVEEGRGQRGAEAPGADHEKLFCSHNFLSS
jgi:hypothetical protein